MKILTTTKNMKIKIEDQIFKTFSTTIDFADGSCVSASGFPTITACMEFANRFRKTKEK